jgi:hypothetical protein
VATSLFAGSSWHQATAHEHQATPALLITSLGSHDAERLPAPCRRLAPCPLPSNATVPRGNVETARHERDVLTPLHRSTERHQFAARMHRRRRRRRRHSLCCFTRRAVTVGIWSVWERQQPLDDKRGGPDYIATLVGPKEACGLT